MNNVLLGILLTLGIAWTLMWYGLALWHAAKNNQRNWFLTILVVDLLLHSLGILDMIYLFKFAKKPLKLKDLMFWKYLKKTEKK